MAVKIFCNACQQFIKNANRKEFTSLTGEEICVSCETKVKNAFDDITKAAQRGIVQIEKLRDETKAVLDLMRKKVIKADDDSI